MIDSRAAEPSVPRKFGYPIDPPRRLLNRCRTAWLRCEEGFVADAPLEEAELELSVAISGRSPAQRSLIGFPRLSTGKCSKPNGGKWSSIQLLAAAIEAFSASYAAILGRRS